MFLGKVPLYQVARSPLLAKKLATAD